MLRIDCPWCGPRDMVDFTYVGDGTLSRPEMGAEDGHFDYVYLRDNPKGPHVEIWRHGVGCRRHVTVTRDTATHEILGVAKPGEAAS